jgi:hypothetical protein
MDNDYVMGFVTRHNQRVQKLLELRPNLSVFDFREPGDYMNKIKYWNSTIIIDSSKQLFKLIFKERTICGNSIMVLPDKQFVFIRSDSHSDILDLSQTEIKEILSEK